jgi:hypothetical protein
MAHVAVSALMHQPRGASAKHAHDAHHQAQMARGRSRSAQWQKAQVLKRVGVPKAAQPGSASAGSVHVCGEADAEQAEDASESADVPPPAWEAGLDRLTTSDRSVVDVINVNRQVRFAVAAAHNLAREAKAKAQREEAERLEKARVEAEHAVAEKVGAEIAAAAIAGALAAAAKDVVRSAEATAEAKVDLLAGTSDLLAAEAGVTVAAGGVEEGGVPLRLRRRVQSMNDAPERELTLTHSESAQRVIWHERTHSSLDATLLTQEDADEADGADEAPAVVPIAADLDEAREAWGMYQKRATSGQVHPPPHEHEHRRTASLHAPAEGGDGASRVTKDEVNENHAAAGEDINQHHGGEVGTLAGDLRARRATLGFRRSRSEHALAAGREGQQAQHRAAGWEVAERFDVRALLAKGRLEQAQLGGGIGAHRWPARSPLMRPRHRTAPKRPTLVSKATSASAAALVTPSEQRAMREWHVQQPATLAYARRVQSRVALLVPRT